MKKLLGILGALSLVATSSSVVVSCNDVASFTGYKDTIVNNLKKENCVDSENKNYNMAQYFSLTDNTLYLTGNGNTNSEDQTKTNSGLPAITFDIFDAAVKQAVSLVVKGSSSDDYTLTYKNIPSGSKESIAFDSSKDFVSGNTILVQLVSKSGSKEWSDSTEIKIPLKDSSSLSLVKGVLLNE